MNMFTYVHHKNQPPQVAGIPTNSRFFSWNLSIDGPMLPSPPLVSGRIPNPIALFPFKLRAPTPILSQHTSPKSPYTIRISQLMSTDIEQHVQSPTPSPTPSQKPPKCSLRSSAFSPTTRSYSALKAKRWRWNGVSPKVIASRGCPLPGRTLDQQRAEKISIVSWRCLNHLPKNKFIPNVSKCWMCAHVFIRPTNILAFVGAICRICWRSDMVWVCVINAAQLEPWSTGQHTCNMPWMTSGAFWPKKMPPK